MISAIDWIIILVYLGLMLLVGFLVGKKESIEDFLVNSRKTKTALLVFTIVSTSVGMGAFLGTASSAYQTGISYGLTVFLASIIGLIFVALFAPKIKRFGDKHNAHTLGDWFGIRYSKNNRILVSLVILIAYFFWTGLQFVGIAGLVHVVTGISFQIALIAAALITIIYTTVAGIKSDFYTDAIQFFVIVIMVFLVLLPLSLIDIGGFSYFFNLPSNYYNLFAFGGISFFLGGLIFGLPIFLVGMEIWQRIYAASSEVAAKKAFLWSTLVVFFMFFPVLLAGLAAIKLVPGVNPDFALFELMKKILPVGFLGIGIAGILAVAMSTVDSLLLVGSVTILKDIHKTFINPDLDEKQMLKFGRIYTFFYGLFGLVAAYLMPNIIKLQIISAATLSVLSPAIIGGFIWKKANSKGAFWSILIGLIITFAFYPWMPTMSFIPGTLTSIILFIVICKLTYKENFINSSMFNFSC